MTETNEHDPAVIGLPEPDCVLGHSECQLAESFGDRIGEFHDYMHGKTLGVCDGAQCAVAHGDVYYSGNVLKFLWRLESSTPEWDALPESLRHPKNLAQLAIAGLPDDRPYKATVMQDVDWREPKVRVLVELPSGYGINVHITKTDDPDLLATKIRYAGNMALFIERCELHPRFLWADQHPDALQERVSPTIRMVDGELDGRWALPAGWVGIVNRTHAGLIDLLDYYEVVRVGNKMSFLRYAIDSRRRRDGGPDVWKPVTDLIMAAKDESLRTCDLCGGPANGTISRGTTRCDDHQPGPGTRYGARARPPGWRPT